MTCFEMTRARRATSAIESSADRGATFPTVMATDVANTGSRTWTAADTPTTRGADPRPRPRVRRADGAAVTMNPAACTISIGASHGVVTMSNPQPAGTHATGVRATRDRGAAADASFQHVVASIVDGVFEDGFEPDP